MKQKKVRQFWLSLEKNLAELYHDIMTLSYTHQPYEQFVIQDTKPRKISVAAVRDRVVHHYASQHLSQRYQKKFYSHSYASQKGKGTTAARKYVLDAIVALKKTSGEIVWIGKMDIRRYFENINHATLLSILSNVVQDTRIFWLCDTIVKSFGSNGKGLPLGNLTSQWFGNIYLNELDWYVKRILNAKWYMRYNDDMVVLSDNEKNVREWVEGIRTFAHERLHLDIPSDKIAVVELPNPIDILGIVTDGTRQWLRRATHNRAKRRLTKRIRALHHQLLDSQCSYASIGVYEAFAF
jgi:retron-type reverse transcriptase